VVGADAGYALTEKFVVFGGLRYYDLSAEVKVTGPLGNTADAETDESWVDPYLGARLHHPALEAWSLNLSGDIGGFGVGSGFAWQGLVTFPLQLTERTGAAGRISLHGRGLRKRQRFQPLRVRHGLLGPGARNRVHVLTGRSRPARGKCRERDEKQRLHGALAQARFLGPAGGRRADGEQAAEQQGDQPCGAPRQVVDQRAALGLAPPRACAELRACASIEPISCCSSTAARVMPSAACVYSVMSNGRRASRRCRAAP